jgi:hypothetical protein
MVTLRININLENTEKHTDMHTTNLTSGKGPFYPTLPYPIPCQQEFEDDDRVTCRGCRLVEKVQQSEFVDLKKANELRSQGKTVAFKGDAKVVAGNWLKLFWDEWQCKATNSPALPLDIRHRCDHHKGASRQPSISKVGDREGGAAWWE